MAKTIVIKIKKAAPTLSKFSIMDNLGNVLGTDIPISTLINGLSLSVDDAVTVIIVSSNSKNCCNKTWNIPVSTVTNGELAAIKFETKKSSSFWCHLNDVTLYNNFYGCISPYIIEYPIVYKEKDEILQNVKDYSKVYKYRVSAIGSFDSNNKIETDNDYFNKAIVYNNQQSTGLLELVAKPSNNLKLYLTFPKYNEESKTITFTKSDNFYQFNTFWSIVKSKTIPLFNTSCEYLSIDKEINIDNMNYINTSFVKYPIRAKDSKVRLILDDKSDVNIVSQFVLTESQISYN